MGEIHVQVRTGEPSGEANNVRDVECGATCMVEARPIWATDFEVPKKSIPLVHIRRVCERCVYAYGYAHQLGSLMAKVSLG